MLLSPTRSAEVPTDKWLDPLARLGHPTPDDEEHYDSKRRPNEPRLHQARGTRRVSIPEPTKGSAGTHRHDATLEPGTEHKPE